MSRRAQTSSHAADARRAPLLFLHLRVDLRLTPPTTNRRCGLLKVHCCSASTAITAVCVVQRAVGRRGRVDVGFEGCCRIGPVGKQGVARDGSAVLIDVDSVWVVE